MEKKKPPRRVPTGTLTERMGEAKNRPNKGTKGGLPERLGRYRGQLSRGGSEKPIRMGRGSMGSISDTRFKPVPLGEKPKALTGPKPAAKETFGSKAAKGLFRGVGGPAVMLVSMTTPAGEGSDKPVQSLRKKYGEPIGPKRPERKAEQAVDRSEKGDKPSKAPVPKARPAGGMTETKRKAAKEFREKMQGRKPSAPKKAKAAPKPSFRGNWVGAAPTEMQKRGGARIKRANLLDAIRKR